MQAIHSSIQMGPCLVSKQLVPQHRENGTHKLDALCHAWKNTLSEKGGKKRIPWCFTHIKIHVYGVSLHIGCWILNTHIPWKKSPVFLLNSSDDQTTENTLTKDCRKMITLEIWGGRVPKWCKTHFLKSIEILCPAQASVQQPWD